LKILVIDGQGGRIGRQLVEAILDIAPDADLVAVGSNSIATASMSKGGAKNIATGENAVIVSCRKADIIAGPIGIIMADALQGEITPAMASAVSQSNAEKVLIPINKCGAIIAGVQNLSMTELIQKAAQAVSNLVRQ